jgi:hypothetical protein
VSHPEHHHQVATGHNETHEQTPPKKAVDYIATMEEVINERRLDWLRNIARQSNEKLLKKFITGWIMNPPRKQKGQKQKLRDYNPTAINQMLVYSGVDTNPSKKCPSKSWIPMGKELGQWKVEITGFQIPKDVKPYCWKDKNLG